VAIVRRAVLWALSGSLLGAALWAIVAGTVWVAMHPMPTASETLREWPWSVFGTGFWAIFVAALAAPAYTVVFAFWQLVLRRHPALDATARRQVLLSLALAAPPVVMLTVGFATAPGFSVDWREVAWVVPVATVSCWGGVYMPRRLIPALRRPLGTLAG
jgi:hypothetical protein